MDRDKPFRPLSKSTGLAACNRTPKSLINRSSTSKSRSTPPLAGLDDRSPKTGRSTTVTKAKIPPRYSPSEPKTYELALSTPPIAVNDAGDASCFDTMCSNYNVRQVHRFPDSGSEDDNRSCTPFRRDNSQTQLVVKVDVGVNCQKHSENCSRNRDMCEPLQSSASCDFMSCVPYQDAMEPLELPSETSAAINVAIRVRPMLPKELADDSVKKCVEVTQDKIKIFSPRVGMGNNQQKEVEFQFDHLFDSCDPSSSNHANQDVIYAELGKPLLDHAMNGYNVCLFAYGQTGSGKSFTITGTPECPGIVSRLGEDLICLMREKNGSSSSMQARLSYYEIYNEEVHDLLSSEYKKPLRVREHPIMGPFVENISSVPLKSFNELKKYIEEADTRRSTAVTTMNDSSSRSHAIVTINIQKTNPSEHSLVPRNISANINLVDLAGSERVSLSSNADRAKEGKLINTSLLTLRKVLTQLAERAGHVSYRESILTWLLKESLGGNSRTTMIATVSPANIHYEETLNTLRYASTARKVIKLVRVNDDENSQTVKDLKLQIEILKAELEQQYNLQLASMTPWYKKDASERKCDSPVVTELTSSMDKYRKFLQDHEKLADSTHPKGCYDTDSAIKRFKDLFPDVFNGESTRKESWNGNSSSAADDWGSVGTSKEEKKTSSAADEWGTPVSNSADKSKTTDEWNTNKPQDNDWGTSVSAKPKNDTSEWGTTPSTEKSKENEDWGTSAIQASEWGETTQDEAKKSKSDSKHKHKHKDKDKDKEKKDRKHKDKHSEKSDSEKDKSLMDSSYKQVTFEEPSRGKDKDGGGMRSSDTVATSNSNSASSSGWSTGNVSSSKCDTKSSSDDWGTTKNETDDWESNTEKDTKSTKPKTIDSADDWGATCTSDKKPEASGGWGNDESGSGWGSSAKKDEGENSNWGNDGADWNSGSKVNNSNQTDKSDAKSNDEDWGNGNDGWGSSNANTNSNNTPANSEPSAAQDDGEW